jgi:hypothetical protein
MIRYHEHQFTSYSPRSKFVEYAWLAYRCVSTQNDRVLSTKEQLNKLRWFVCVKLYCRWRSRTESTSRATSSLAVYDQVRRHKADTDRRLYSDLPARLKHVIRQLLHSRWLQRSQASAPDIRALLTFRQRSCCFGFKTTNGDSGCPGFDHAHFGSSCACIRQSATQKFTSATIL